MLSEAYEGEAMRKSSTLCGINGSKAITRTWNMIKTVNITFFDIKGTVHLEFIPQSHTVNKGYYVEICKRLREAVSIKMPQLWPNELIIPHGNAPATWSFQFSGPKIDYRNGTLILFP
jgi:hypothetical protein